MRVLDRWEGKLTWPLFCGEVAKVLQVDTVSRHTLMRYEAIKLKFWRVFSAQLFVSTCDFGQKWPICFDLVGTRRVIVQLTMPLIWYI